MDGAEAKQRELNELTTRLLPQLQQGMLQRMQHASWYLTGVQVGLQSLKAFYEISELVYREHTARSEGGRRLANLKNVYNKLNQFAHQGMDAQRRAEVMIDIRRPLQTLLREFRGWGDTQQAAARDRKTIISQLAADIRMSLLRLRSFEKMQQDLAQLQSPRFWLAKKAKLVAAERLRSDHIGYAVQFGFDDATALLDGATVKASVGKVDRATNQLRRQIDIVHKKLYRDRFANSATSDLKADLQVAKTMPILQSISMAGFDYLNRAHNAYEHALQMVNGDVGLLRRVTDLAAEIEEAEVAQMARKP